MLKMIFKAAIILGIVGATALGMSSCSKNETIIYEIEHVTVQLNSKELLEVVSQQRPFMAQAGRRTMAVTDEYNHVFPTNYKAYFVSKETKGQYSAGDVVGVIDVVAGNNTITIPALDYSVYITNYEKEGPWYTWEDAIQQLPQTSPVLFLYGKNDIDYSRVTEGTVEVKNPYAGVMIRNNTWIAGAPVAYDTNQEYFITPSNVWYAIYTRNSDANTKIPISIPGNPNTHYTLHHKLDANTVYRFTIDGNVEEGEGGLTVEVPTEFKKIVDKTIKL